MGRAARLAAGFGVCVLALAGCSAGSSDAPSAPASAGKDAVVAASCPPFPAADIAPDPSAPYPAAYGDPQQPASLQALRTAVIGAVQSPDYPKNGTVCAEGSDTPAQCDVDYWVGRGTPGKEEDCNFYYLRVADEYWKNAVPMVLSQYHGYLGVSSDGRDATNQAAGPHITLAQYSSGWVNFGAKGTPVTEFALTGGKLTAADTAAQLQAVVPGAVAGNAGTISPVLAADTMKIDCSTIWTYDGRNWTQTTLDAVTPTAGLSFACVGTGTGVGTAYVEARLGTPGESSIPAAVSINVSSTKWNTLRQDPTGPFTSSNVVWPVATKEVRAAQQMPFTIQTGDACPNDAGTGNESCLHLWVNFPSSESQSVGPTYLDDTEKAALAASPSAGDAQQLLAAAQSTMACKIWFTLGIDSPETLQMIESYGLSADDYSPHISLAKKTWNTNEIGPPSGTAVGQPDPCTDARNIALGQPGVDPFNPNWPPAQ